MVNTKMESYSYRPFGQLNVKALAAMRKHMTTIAGVPVKEIHYDQMLKEYVIYVKINNIDLQYYLDGVDYDEITGQVIIRHITVLIDPWQKLITPAGIKQLTECLKNIEQNELQ